MSSVVMVAPADRGPAFNDFIDLAYRTQRDNPLYAPLLRIQQKDLLNREKHPFFQHAEMALFVAYRDGEPVGRIAAINDDAHNRTHNETTTHFGFFECIDDKEVSAALFGAVRAKARAWGHTMIRGPFNPSINESAGLHIDGFDTSNFVLMPGNPAYYVDLVEAAGFRKAMDLLCYILTVAELSERARAAGERIRKRTKITFRHASRRHLWRDMMKIWDVYNRAWEKNWGAVPITEAEFRHLVNDLKLVADFDLIVMAENEAGELVGFSVALPDINEGLRKLQDGRLFPFGFLKLLPLIIRKNLKGGRIAIMGVLEEYRGRGIDAVMYLDHYEVARAKGSTQAEMSWILETNDMMNRAARMLGGELYKTYRIYEKRV